MRIDEFDFEKIITAERGMFLKPINEPDNELKFGKPERIIFSKRGPVPEFRELPLDFEVATDKVEEVAETVEEEKSAKTTRKKSSK